MQVLARFPASAWKILFVCLYLGGSFRPAVCLAQVVGMHCLSGSFSAYEFWLHRMVFFRSTSVLERMQGRRDATILAQVALKLVNATVLSQPL